MANKHRDLNQLNHRDEDGSRIDRGLLGTDENSISLILEGEPKRCYRPPSS